MHTWSKIILNLQSEELKFLSLKHWNYHNSFLNCEAARVFILIRRQLGTLHESWESHTTFSVVCTCHCVNVCLLELSFLGQCWGLMKSLQRWQCKNVNLLIQTQGGSLKVLINCKLITGFTWFYNFFHPFQIMNVDMFFLLKQSK